MKPGELFHMWVTDRRATLLSAARKAESAYTKGPLATMCSEYARRLRAAADALGSPDYVPPEQGDSK